MEFVHLTYLTGNPAYYQKVCTLTAGDPGETCDCYQRVACLLLLVPAGDAHPEAPSQNGQTQRAVPELSEPTDGPLGPA